MSGMREAFAVPADGGVEGTKPSANPVPVSFHERKQLFFFFFSFVSHWLAPQTVESQSREYIEAAEKGSMNISFGIEASNDGSVFALPTKGGELGCDISSHEKFYAVYGETKGVAAAFELIQNSNETLWIRAPPRDTEMTVNNFVKFWDDTVSKAKKGALPKIVYYLKDIEVKARDMLWWYKQDPLIYMLSESGLCDLHTYARLFKKDMILPDLWARMYLAPPVYIGTPWHFDGGGMSLSVHSYIWGGGYQLIGCWPRLSQHELKKVLPLLNREQEGIWFRPHDPYNSRPETMSERAFTLKTGSDLSACCISEHICSKLKELGVRPHARFTLMPGNTVFLPDGCGHSFQKVPFNNATLSATTLARMTKNDLMLSIAGFFSFLFFSFLFSSFST